MVEVRASFATPAEWQGLLDKLGDFSAARQRIIADVRRFGLIEPISGTRRPPHEVAIRPDNLHETFGAHGLNSRKRALLAQIDIELRRRGLAGDLSLRILATDALSHVALILRGAFPRLAGVEAGGPEDAPRAFPVQVARLACLPYGEGAFDLVTTVDALEHVEDADDVLREFLRVLKPGGLLVVPLPVISNLHPAQQGADLVEKLQGWGCATAYCTTIASSRFGIASEGKPGPIIVTAEKAGQAIKPAQRPPDVMVRGPLPDKLCVLLALPRSGTTLVTSLFAVHSGVTAVYEPWNAKRLPTDRESDIAALALAEKLPDLTGRLLFVKETAAQASHIERLRALCEATPHPVEKTMMLLLRKPELTYLSEVTRRAEWWDAKVEVGFPSFQAWCEKSRRSLRQMLAFAAAANGLLVTLEAVAGRPEDLLRQLCDRLGIAFERQQLDYQQHLDTAKVRGDLNVSRAPEKIDTAKVDDRSEDAEAIAAWLEVSAHAPWFVAFRDLHHHVSEQGGLVVWRDVPPDLVAPLTGA
jgi:SAM-dependent methyltransferase